MTKTNSSSYINESISNLKTTTDHHAHSLQEITQQLNANTQQLNAISIALQKLTKAEEKRQQQSMSPKSPISKAVTLPLSNRSKSVRLDFPRFKGDDPASCIYKANQYFGFYQTPCNERAVNGFFPHG